MHKWKGSSFFLTHRVDTSETRSGKRSTVLSSNLYRKFTMWWYFVMLFWFGRNYDWVIGNRVILYKIANVASKQATLFAKIMKKYKYTVESWILYIWQVASEAFAYLSWPSILLNTVMTIIIETNRQTNRYKNTHTHKCIKKIIQIIQ